MARSGLSVGDRLNRMRESGSRPAIRFHEVGGQPSGHLPEALYSEIEWVMYIYVLRRNSARNTGVVLIMHGPLRLRRYMTHPVHPVRHRRFFISPRPAYLPIFIRRPWSQVKCRLPFTPKIDRLVKIFIRFTALLCERYLVYDIRMTSHFDRKAFVQYFYEFLINANRERWENKLREERLYFKGIN